MASNFKIFNFLEHFAPQWDLIMVLKKVCTFWRKLFLTKSNLSYYQLRIWASTYFCAYDCDTFKNDIL